MPRPTRPRCRQLTGLVLILALGATGCATAADDEQADTRSGGPDPVTVENCGDRVTVPRPPERLVLLKSAAVPALDALGVLDRAVARAGVYPEGYYDAQTRAQLQEIEHLTGETGPAGHLQVSQEVVIAHQPDLVLGEVENLTRDTLATADVPVLEEPALCPGGLADPGFDNVYAQLAMYGRVFDRQERAREVIAALRQRVAAVEEQVGARDGRTAAVLYPTVGGGATYAYGSRSMADPQLRTAGFTNVFGDVDQRVFEVSAEDLVARDPDVLVLLHSDGDPAAVERAVTRLPGAQQITAVARDQVMTHLFNFTEPPTPLTVTGLEKIVARFQQ